MKILAAIAVLLVVCFIGFLAGRSPSDQAVSDTIPPRESRQRVNRPRAETSASSLAQRALRDRLTPRQAATLSAEERKKLFETATTLADTSRQSAILCGLIEVMGADELPDATRMLMEAQSNGNPWAAETWSALWRKWGELDPLGCLELSANERGLNTTSDAENFMSGWMEVDPVGALEWARQPHETIRDSAAAARAIVASAAPGLAGMETAIIKNAADFGTHQQALHDYFDLALVTPEVGSLQSAFEGLDPSLQVYAWSVVSMRLSHMDSTQAKEWVSKNLDKPGADYESMQFLVRKLTDENPLEAATWAASLPVKLRKQRGYDPPLLQTLSLWSKSDPGAAQNWIDANPGFADRYQGTE